MRTEARDVVVIGGGPAGTSFAITLGKYAPEVRVTVLEADRHPRYHVGESTVPVINSVFRDLGLFDLLYDGRFVRKMGVTFVWGKDREPWDADYLQIEKLPHGDGTDVINVLGQDFTELLRTERVRDIPLTAINVRRAEFDHLLCEQARRLGAEVREGTRATRLVRDAAGAVAAVEWADEAGATGRIETPFVLDASGLRAFCTGADREYDPAMANFAVNGYLSGADWKVLFRGRKDATTVFIASIEEGWIWYIPVGDDLISVGVVTRTEHFKRGVAALDLEAFFWGALRGCREIEPLIRRAHLRDDVMPGGRRVAAHKDWTGWARSPIGPGWAAAGDAAIFVDPILSSGLTLAVQSGHRAAYTYNTARKRPELDAAALWQAYADFIRGEAGSYLTLARYFYGNNTASDSVHWQAWRLVNGRGRLDLDPRAAFTMATAGFFPTPKAISVEIMAPLLRGLAGTDADLFNIYHDDGLPPADLDLDPMAMAVATPFHLALRTQPDEHKAADGLLTVFHDLVPDAFDFAHRTQANPCRMAPALAPVVEAMSRFGRVGDLVAAAPALLPPGFAEPDAVRASTRALVRNAARKGFVTLTPAPRLEAP